MPTHHRRAFRHAVALSCQIVRERDFRLVADVALDLSTDGMLVATELPVLTGEELLVSFRAPRGARWVDAQAVVTRVVHGRRPGERGRRLGIAFEGLGDEVRHLLFRQLSGLPPVTRGSARGRAVRRTGAC
jgi:PilZ domain